MSAHISITRGRERSSGQERVIGVGIIFVAVGSSAASDSSRNSANTSLNAYTSSAGSIVVDDGSASGRSSVRGKRKRPGVDAACGERKASSADRNISKADTAATTGTVFTT